MGKLDLKEKSSRERCQRHQEHSDSRQLLHPQGLPEGLAPKDATAIFEQTLARIGLKLFQITIWNFVTDTDGDKGFLACADGFADQQFELPVAGGIELYTFRYQEYKQRLIFQIHK